MAHARTHTHKGTRALTPPRTPLLPPPPTTSAAAEVPAAVNRTEAHTHTATHIYVCVCIVYSCVRGRRCSPADNEIWLCWLLSFSLCAYVCVSECPAYVCLLWPVWLIIVLKNTLFFNLNRFHYFNIRTWTQLICLNFLTATKKFPRCGSRGLNFLSSRRRRRRHLAKALHITVNLSAFAFNYTIWIGPQSAHCSLTVFKCICSTQLRLIRFKLST